MAPSSPPIRCTTVCSVGSSSMSIGKSGIGCRSIGGVCRTGPHGTGVPPVGKASCRGGVGTETTCGGISGLLCVRQWLTILPWRSCTACSFRSKVLYAWSRAVCCNARASCCPAKIIRSASSCCCFLCSSASRSMSWPAFATWALMSCSSSSSLDSQSRTTSLYWAASAVTIAFSIWPCSRNVARSATVASSCSFIRCLHASSALATSASRFATCSSIFCTLSICSRMRCFSSSIAASCSSCCIFCKSNASLSCWSWFLSFSNSSRAALWVSIPCCSVVDFSLCASRSICAFARARRPSSTSLCSPSSLSLSLCTLRASLFNRLRSACNAFCMTSISFVCTLMFINSFSCTALALATASSSTTNIFSLFSKAFCWVEWLFKATLSSAACVCI
mmetsp:Transcript_87988/g.153030  ORF Transcript_87988/g.153030 Transcript_87988/m.153030 type:complete len:392 (+) Transcript_87988:843-2018(+)